MALWGSKHPPTLREAGCHTADGKTMQVTSGCSVAADGWMMYIEMICGATIPAPTGGLGSMAAHSVTNPAATDLNALPQLLTLPANVLKTALHGRIKKETSGLMVARLAA